MSFNTIPRDEMREIIEKIEKDGELYYHNRKQDPSPKNATMKRIADHLCAGQAAYVRLEPGDGTRYEFFLLPMWNLDLRPSGRGLNPTMHWLWIAPINLTPNKVFGDAVGFEGSFVNSFYDLTPIYNNEWTCTQIAFFLLKLREEFDGV